MNSLTQNPAINPHPHEQTNQLTLLLQQQSHSPTGTRSINNVREAFSLLNMDWSDLAKEEKKRKKKEKKAKKSKKHGKSRKSKKRRRRSPSTSSSSTNITTESETESSEEEEKEDKEKKKRKGGKNKSGGDASKTKNITVK